MKQDSVYTYDAGPTCWTVGSTGSGGRSFSLSASSFSSCISRSALRRAIISRMIRMVTRSATAPKTPIIAYVTVACTAHSTSKAFCTDLLNSNQTHTASGGSGVFIFFLGGGALGWRHFHLEGHTTNTFALNYRVCNRLYQNNYTHKLYTLTHTYKQIH